MFFYTEELALVGASRLETNKRFMVERVLRTRGRDNKKQLFVKWSGYPDKFNSLVKASDLEIP